MNRGKLLHAELTTLPILMPSVEEFIIWARDMDAKLEKAENGAKRAIQESERKKDQAAESRESKKLKVIILATDGATVNGEKVLSLFS